MKQHGKIIRRMGYIRDQEGIMNRYLRERSNWDRHLHHTRAFIRESFSDPAVETVAVLGSGWLLDVPLDDLRSRFRRVFLVDIHHPPQIRKKVEGFENVELIEADLSGGAIRQLWELRRQKNRWSAASLPDRLALHPPLEHLPADGLISVNLLNQLDIILCDYLDKQGYFQQDPSFPLRSALQKFHLQWISGNPGCLISDVEEISTNKEGKSSSKSLLYTALPEGIRRDSWTWDFDSRGTYRPQVLTTMKVMAVEWA
jgi:hypothetical protein